MRWRTFHHRAPNADDRRSSTLASPVVPARQPAERPSGTRTSIVPVAVLPADEMAPTVAAAASE